MSETFEQTLQRHLQPLKARIAELEREVELRKLNISELDTALRKAQWGSCDGCGQLRQCPLCKAKRHQLADDGFTHVDGEHFPACEIGRALRNHP